MTGVRPLSEHLNVEDHERLVLAMKGFVSKYVIRFAGGMKCLLKCGHRINNGNQDMRHTTAAVRGTPRHSSEMD
jgi:hypothetical protein